MLIIEKVPVYKNIYRIENKGDIYYIEKKDENKWKLAIKIGNNFSNVGIYKTRNEALRKIEKGE